VAEKVGSRKKESEARMEHGAWRMEDGEELAGSGSGFFAPTGREPRGRRQAMRAKFV
jgi:hypothetical protein